MSTSPRRQHAPAAADNGRANHAVISSAVASFDLLLAGHPVPAWIYDRATLRILAVNDTALREYGYSRDEFLALRISDIRPPDDVPPLMTVVARHQPAGAPSRWRHRCRDGTIIDVEITSHVLALAPVEAVLVLARNVTAQREAEDARARLAAEAEEATRRAEFLAQASALLASSLDYETTLKHTAELAVPHIGDWCSVEIVAADGSIQTLAITHRDPALRDLALQLRRNHPVDPAAPAGIPAVIRNRRSELVPEITDTMLAATVRNEELLALLRRIGMRSLIAVPLTGQENVLGAISLIRTAHSAPYTAADLRMAEELAARAAMAIDNARLYRQARDAHERLRRLNEELEQRVADRTAQLAAANRELEAFAYSVSHDLRAPLRGIDGFSKVLLDRYTAALDETGRDYLHRVRAASQRMAQLIDDLLEISRVTRRDIHFAPVDLSALARAIAAELQATEPQRQVEWVIAGDLHARGDQALLHIALTNLLGNAWKFTSRHPHARIEVGACRHDGHLAYYVRDDGAGFDARYADKMFAPFQRLHTVSEFEGTGIGLATVERIIRRHGGTIHAEGAPEQGATFTFTLGAP